MTKDPIEEAFSTERALKLALEALKHCVDAITERGLNGNPEFAEKWGLKLPVDRASEAITAIKQALNDATHLAAPVQDSDHQFKNFHRVLCERFGYTHDEVDWKRDQVSLIEWIAKQVKPAAPVQDVDWKEMYEKEKRRSEMWIAKYEKDIGPLEKVAPAAPVQEPDTYGYAKRLAEAIWEKHYKSIAPQWKPFDHLIGVLTQIDNMTSGLTTPPAEQPALKPLTDEEMKIQVEAELVNYWNGEYADTTGAKDCLTEFARAIEAKLKEKNT